MKKEAPDVLARARDACPGCARLVPPGLVHACGEEVARAEKDGAELRAAAATARARVELLESRAQQLMTQAQVEAMRAQALEREADVLLLQARHDALVDNLEAQGTQLAEALRRLAALETQPAVVPEE